MNKNTVIAFILIGITLIGFNLLNKPSEAELAKQKEQLRQDSIANAQSKSNAPIDNTSATPQQAKESTVSGFFTASNTQQDSIKASANNADSLKNASTSKEQIYTLENKKVKIDISSRGGQMISAQIKNYKKFDGDSLFLFNNDASLSLLLTNKEGKILRTDELSFTPVKTGDKQSLIMRFAYSDSQHIDFIYTLTDDNYMLNYDVNIVGFQSILNRDKADIIELEWAQKLNRQENSIKNEQRYSHVYYKYLGGDVNNLSDSKDEQQEIKEPTKWIAFKNQFFATVLIADQKIETVLLDSKVLKTDDYLKSCAAHLYIPAKIDQANGNMSAGFSYYMGPMVYSNLKDYDKNIKDANQQLDLDKLVPLGWAIFRWVNQFFIIPIFNFLTNTGISIGIVILLLTLIVKIVISPLTYKSYISSAKMRVLKPQVDEINAKYPKTEQAMEKQQAVMALYNRVGVNPMSGCIPMLLQMPILIALFQFFPNAIELRQQSFLWAHDLSTYDAIFSWHTPIPLIDMTHISLFCILMTITNVIYTKFNMDMTGGGQQQMPGMKWMMYLMPLIFLFVLNDYPSGLTYYYFISLLMTILMTLGFRFIVKEHRILAKLEANKNKPRKKKSGFMARLEEAQRMQQQRAREQSKGNAKKKK